MEDGSKRGGQTFLQKFKGRTNRIDKSGPSQALDPTNLPTPRNDEKLLNHPRRLASLQHGRSAEEYQIPRVDLDKLIPSNPEGKYHFSKRNTHAKINPNKLDYVPSIYESPVGGSKGDGLGLPPSRSISDKSENLQRRVFGKYLKLDEQAKKHLQYLQQMDKDRAKRKGTGYATER